MLAIEMKWLEFHTLQPAVNGLVAKTQLEPKYLDILNL